MDGRSMAENSLRPAVGRGCASDSLVRVRIEAETLLVIALLLNLLTIARGRGVSNNHERPSVGHSRMLR